MMRLNLMMSVMPYEQVTSNVPRQWLRSIFSLLSLLKRSLLQQRQELLPVTLELHLTDTTHL